MDALRAPTLDSSRRFPELMVQQPAGVRVRDRGRPGVLDHVLEAVELDPYALEPETLAWPGDQRAMPTGAPHGPRTTDSVGSAPGTR